MDWGMRVEQQYLDAELGMPGVSIETALYLIGRIERVEKQNAMLIASFRRHLLQTTAAGSSAACELDVLDAIDRFDADD